MKRNEAKTERTIKMAGTDWSQYAELIGKRKEYLHMQIHRDVWVSSEDGLKLHAVCFPCGEGTRVVVCFHGYTSEGMKDYIALSDYYLKHGYSMLLADERAHGKGEGEYIGFNFEHQVKAVSRDKLEYFYYYLCRIMFKGIEDAGRRIGDIINAV